jgi:hypothetical protein
VGVRAEIAESRQDRRSSRPAAPGQGHKKLAVRARRQERQDQRCALKLLEAVGGCEAKTVRCKVIDRVELCGAPLAAVAATLPPFQTAGAAGAADCRRRWGRRQEPQRRGRGQVFEQWIYLREREVESGAPLIPPLTEPCREGHVALPQTGSSLERGGAFDGQHERAWPPQVTDPVRIFFLGCTGALRHGLAGVPHRVAGDQTDRLPTACEPFVEGVPGDTRGVQGDQEPLTPGFNQRMAASLCKAPATLPGVGKRQRATAYDGLRASTGIAVGFTPIDANE